MYVPRAESSNLARPTYGRPSTRQEHSLVSARHRKNSAESSLLEGCGQQGPIMSRHRSLLHAGAQRRDSSWKLEHRRPRSGSARSQCHRIFPKQEKDNKHKASASLGQLCLMQTPSGSGNARLHDIGSGNAQLLFHAGCLPTGIEHAQTSACFPVRPANHKAPATLGALLFAVHIQSRKRRGF